MLVTDFESLLNDLPEVNLPFQYWLPITKSATDSITGEIKHEGLATDESLDVEDDLIPHDLLRKSIPYLNNHGRFNWDHGPDIGDVLDARIITAEEAARIYPEAQVLNRAMNVKGTVWPLVDPRIAPDELKTAHHQFLAGARLGYSLDGKVLRNPRSREITAMFVPKVAITGSPINGNTTCRLVKSLTALIKSAAGVGEEAAGQTALLGVVVANTPGLRDNPGRVDDYISIPKSMFDNMVASLLKSCMMAGGGVNAAEFTGGRALGRESLGRSVHTPLWGGDDRPKKKRRRKRKKGAVAKPATPDTPVV